MVDMSNLVLRRQVINIYKGEYKLGQTSWLLRRPLP